MPKALRRFLLAVFVVAMQGVAQGEQVLLPGAHHEVDGATWSDTLVQDLNHQCATLQPTQPAPAYCGNFWVRVHNDTDDFLQCQVTLGIPGDKDAADWGGVSDLVVAPGRENSTNTLKGAASLSPVSFSTNCWRVPKQALPMGGNPPCPVETAIDNPDDFYPPGSIRRVESGEAIIEFTVDAGGTRVRDVRLVQTSGFTDLDSAALKLSRAFKVSMQCGTQRVRRSVVFDMSTDPRDWRSTGCVIYSPPRMVLITDPESK